MGESQGGGPTQSDQRCSCWQASDSEFSHHLLVLFVLDDSPQFQNFIFFVFLCNNRVVISLLLELQAAVVCLVALNGINASEKRAKHSRLTPLEQIY